MPRDCTFVNPGEAADGQAKPWPGQIPATCLSNLTSWLSRGDGQVSVKPRRCPDCAAVTPWSNRGGHLPDGTPPEPTAASTDSKPSALSKAASSRL
eukprot:CAMPEP_0119371086 /NCGR_PEP_ID=MMETSP1334-20130426/17340_1 /TAXON_ID=127549 /ORGANISM="Calcidiscus leptoporus, Strain RCC1130" /LENGTH=95 /DNA_ID=CAMNT_0007388291 /DNA_START=277 /DNA_END=562 /DNA_ORIENTATION=-